MNFQYLVHSLFFLISIPLFIRAHYIFAYLLTFCVAATVTLHVSHKGVPFTPLPLVLHTVCMMQMKLSTYMTLNTCMM